MTHLSWWLHHVCQGLHDAINPRLALVGIGRTQNKALGVRVHLKVVAFSPIHLAAEEAVEGDDTQRFGWVLGKGGLVRVVRQVVSQDEVPVLPVLVPASTTSQLAQDALRTVR